MASCAILESRALLTVKGEDAPHFLERLVTCEVEELAPGGLAFGALLTPQGKILFDFFVYRQDDGFLLDTDASRAEELAKRLAFYRLRAKVEIGPADPDARVVACWGDPASGTADPRLAAMGTRSVAPDGDLKEITATEADWHAHRIRLGMPQGGLDHGWGETFPHEALMDTFGGVDFAKGCYVGQEVVSRMQHRGTARSRIVSVSAASPLPPAGTPVEAAGKSCGTMGSSAGTLGLALLRLDRVAEAMASGGEITAGGVRVEATLQPWAGFGWPEA